jgi:thiamine-phosphate pyrophosphorylase
VKALWVTDRTSCGDERYEEILRALGGAPDLAVELREKGGLSDLDLLARARHAREALGASVPLWVNRRFDVALAAGAAGVHLPADGLPVRRVRANTPRGFSVGVSTHSPEEARRAIEDGADVVVLGPIFDTPGKRVFGSPLSPAALDGLPLLEEHGAAVYAIGGISLENAEEIARRADRVSGIAAIRVFQDSPDPRAAAGRIAGL